MAKTNGPLFSLGAHGSLSKTLNYSRRRSGDQCRKHNKPTGIPSAKQRGQRRLTEFLVAQWQNMSAADKATWAANARGTGLNLSGYHYFLRSAQKDLYTHHGLVGYWHCNEIIGGQVLDLSGNGNHGTLQPGYPANAPTLVNSEKTRFSKALSYDGVDEYVDCGNANSVNLTDELTLLARAKIISIPTDTGNIIEKDSYDSYRMGVRNIAGKLYPSCTVKTDGGYTNLGIRELALNEWYWFVLTFKRDDIVNVYINAILDDTDAPEAGALSQRAVNVKLGVDTKQQYLNAIIDEVCIYKRFFSAAEITTRYNFANQKVG